MLHHCRRKSFSLEGKIMPIRCCHIKPCGRKSIWPALAQSGRLESRSAGNIGSDAKSVVIELFDLNFSHRVPVSVQKEEGTGKRWINVSGKVLSEKLKHRRSRKCFRLNRERSGKELNLPERADFLYRTGQNETQRSLMWHQVWQQS